MNKQELAQHAFNRMERARRDDGSEYWTVMHNADQWVTDLAHAAHGDMLPDDWRYAMVQSALDVLADDETDNDGPWESISETISVYASDNLAWLASRIDRYSYVDDAVEDFGHGQSILDDIRAGELRERLEVFELVESFLIDLAEREAVDA